MVPIEDRIEHIFSSYFDISRFFSIALHFFGIVVVNFLSLSVKIELHLFIFNLAVIHLSKFLPLCHFPLFGKEVQLWLFFLLEVLSSFFILLMVLH